MLLSLRATFPSPRVLLPSTNSLCQAGTDISIPGSPKQYDVTGASGKINHHFFCGDCGSSLYTRLDVMPGNIIIKAGGLDNGKANLDNKINVEFYCRDRVSYLQAAEGAKQEHLFG
ncbi:hypothetical protein LB503_007435 [Fusarium chuoi]|nr:hypothetical protein LB503_007435 [Fusarium chuoi]